MPRYGAARHEVGRCPGLSRWPAAATGCLACRRLDRCNAAPQLPRLHRAASEVNAKLSTTCLAVCAASITYLCMFSRQRMLFCARFAPIACPAPALALYPLHQERPRATARHLCGRSSTALLASVQATTAVRVLESRRLAPARRLPCQPLR